MAGKKVLPRTKRFVNENPLEALRDVGEGVVDSMGDLLRESTHDFWKQLLGTSEKESTQKSGELTEGQELNLAKQKNDEEETIPDTEPAIDYRREILQAERTSTRETEVLETKIQEIIIELKHLVASSQTLEVEFKEVSQQQVIVKPGKYHLNFFEWLLSAVRSARERVEDSSAWLSAMQSKKSKKGYWNMFKKHGTTFGLSGERVVATQTG